MRRVDQPECLATNADSWTERWVALLEADPKTGFAWPDVPCRLQIRAALNQSTSDRCAYCAVFPMSPMEIDHFLTKKKYAGKAFEWTNLYPCCGWCNRHKSQKDPIDVLRPDVEGFSFGRYFSLDLLSGAINANPVSPEHDQAKAVATIGLFRLNDAERRRVRLLALIGQRPTLPNWD